ncbi:MAG: hypothetical protein RIR26_385 [Pseudomonadota bacterium]
MTVAWAPGKKKIYEFLLESLEELDLENSTEKASKLGESIDAEFVRIADEPDNSVRCGGTGLIEYRGKSIEYSDQTGQSYFIWFTYHVILEEVLVFGVSPIAPDIFPQHHITEG